MFKAHLYTTLLHACMLMQEKGNANLCGCNLKQNVQAKCSRCSLASCCLISCLFTFLRKKRTGTILFM